eukprot:TRINITY_DN2055_c0_g1_i5.p1 TRINITY_DN2055_c0_g1~~TRINITY_DN2055_c0_g1_i5.p1  ORF type:complete len:291 (+),score=32.49 TRINITY_DN2055_c0_g1_i5:119-991(+)
MERSSQTLNSPLLIILPIFLPGTNKIRLIPLFERACKTLGISFESITNDDIRNQAINQYFERNKEGTKEEAYQATSKMSTQNFDNFVKQKIEKSSEDFKCLFIDKTHPPGAIKKVFKIITSIQRKNVKVIGLVPKCLTNYELMQTDYPFSPSYILHCFGEYIKQKKFETDQESVAVGALFLKLFEGFDMNPSLMKLQGFAYTIYVPITVEKPGQDIVMDARFGKALHQVMRGPPSTKSTDTALLTELLDSINKMNHQFEVPSAETLEAHISDEIKKVVALFKGAKISITD